MSEVYGWSHISRVYHVVKDQAAHGWVKTVCCGERWIDTTADRAPDLAPCRNQEQPSLVDVYGPCAIPGCTAALQARGLCSHHYKRFLEAKNWLNTPNTSPFQDGIRT